MSEDSPTSSPRPAFSRRFYALFLLALIIRVAFAAEFLDKNLGRETDPLRDMRHFQRGAELFLEGDLTLSGLYAEYQPIIDEYPPGAFREFYGDRPLTHAPLYSALMAITLKIWGSPALTRVLQIMANLLLVLLVYRLTRAFSEREEVALLAAALFSLNPTAVFYAAFLLRATLISVLLALFVLALVRYIRAPARIGAVAIGLILGVLHLAKSTLPLTAPVVLLALLLAPGSRRRRAIHAGCVLLAFFLMTSPLMVRSLYCDTSLLHSESFAHFGIVVHNRSGLDGLHFRLPPPGLVPEIMEKAGDSLPATLYYTIKSHPSLLSWLQLMSNKLQGFFNGYVAHNNVNYNVYVHVLDTLSLFPIVPLLLLPPALVGLFLSLGPRRLPRRWPLLAGLLIVLAMCLATSPMGRLRIPSFPFLAILAALAFEDGLVTWRARKRERRRLVLLVGLLTLGVLIAWPMHNTGDDPPHKIEWIRGGIYEQSGQLERARRHAIRAAILLPVPHPPVRGGRIPATPEWRLFSDVHSWAYRLCREAKDEAGAAEVRAHLSWAMRDQSSRE